MASEAKEESILYDLIVHTEWPLEGETLVSIVFGMKGNMSYICSLAIIDFMA